MYPFGWHNPIRIEALAERAQPRRMTRRVALLLDHFSKRLKGSSWTAIVKLCVPQSAHAVAFFDAPWRMFTAWAEISKCP